MLRIFQTFHVILTVVAEQWGPLWGGFCKGPPGERVLLVFCSEEEEASWQNTPGLWGLIFHLPADTTKKGTRELTFAKASAGGSGRRRSGPKGRKAFLKNRKIRERKPRQTVCLRMCVAHRLVLEAVGGDHGLSQVQNVSSHICKCEKLLSQHHVWDRRDRSSNVKEFLHSRWHFMATVMSTFILILLSTTQQNVRTVWCNNYVTPLRLTNLPRIILIDFILILHPSVPINKELKNSQKCHGAEGDQGHCGGDGLSDDCSVLVLLTNGSMTEETDLFLLRLRSPRSSLTLSGRRPAPSASSGLSCGSAASSLGLGQSTSFSWYDLALV